MEIYIKERKNKTNYMKIAPKQLFPLIYLRPLKNFQTTGESNVKKEKSKASFINFMIACGK